LAVAKGKKETVERKQLGKDLLSIGGGDNEGGTAFLSSLAFLSAEQTRACVRKKERKTKRKKEVTLTEKDRQKETGPAQKSPNTSTNKAERRKEGWNPSPFNSFCCRSFVHALCSPCSFDLNLKPRTDRKIDRKEERTEVDEKREEKDGQQREVE